MTRKSKAKAKPLRYRQGIHQDNTARDKRIMELRSQGMSFKAIGEQFKPMLSGERVSQIVRRGGPGQPAAERGRAAPT